MAQYGLLIDYSYCTGCHSCEFACQQEFDFKGEMSGIKLTQVGPFQLGNGKWEFDYVPVPTKLCSLCNRRVGKGKVPACVAQCQSKCMSYGEIIELAEKITSPQQVLFSVR